MDKEHLNNLREAIQHSPENIPLRLHFGEALMQEKSYQEAAEQFKYVLKKEQVNDKANLGLATVYLEQKEYSGCIILLEEYLYHKPDSVDALILLSKAYLREGSKADAQNVYKSALLINPGAHDEELDDALRVAAGMVSEEMEEAIEDEEDDKFLEKPDIGFDDIGGLDNIKKEIDLKIIKPLQNAEIYKAYGKKIGGGILLYGPPGCGKTHLARATAGQIDARFISVGINDVLDMWMGNSEKNLHELFELARRHTPCVLFFDEIDALGANRSDMRQSSGRHLINQFLSELDGLDNQNDGLLILGATNAPWHLDPAFRRPGRFDRIIFVTPPDVEAREQVFKIMLEGKPITDVDFKKLARKSEKFSGADIQAAIDVAIEDKLEASFSSGVPEPLSTADLLKAIKKQKSSTTEWFHTAKNYALYANESGLYDDILSYLNIKK